MRDYKIYAVDFDGTLCFSQWPKLGEANAELIEKLKECKNNGDKLILWTCRQGENLGDAVQWCKEKGLYFDAVNDNLQEIKDLFGNNSRKITADIYIDDKGMPWRSFLYNRHPGYEVKVRIKEDLSKEERKYIDQIIGEAAQLTEMVAHEDGITYSKKQPCLPGHELHSGIEFFFKLKNYQDKYLELTYNSYLEGVIDGRI